MPSARDDAPRNPSQWIKGNLVGLGSAAVLAVYSAGYARTREAARRFEGEDRQRHAAIPAATVASAHEVAPAIPAPHPVSDAKPTPTVSKTAKKPPQPLPRPSQSGARRRPTPRLLTRTPSPPHHHQLHKRLRPHPPTPPSNQKRLKSAGKTARSPGGAARDTATSKPLSRSRQAASFPRGSASAQRNTPARGSTPSPARSSRVRVRKSTSSPARRRAPTRSTTRWCRHSTRRSEPSLRPRRFAHGDRRDVSSRRA